MAGQKDPIYLSIPPASARLKSNTIQTKYINWVLKFTLTNYPIMIAFNCSIDGVLNLKSIINQLSACLLCLDVDANEDISAFPSIREETSALGRIFGHSTAAEYNNRYISVRACRPAG